MTTPIRPKTIKESRRNRLPQKTVSRFRLRIVFCPQKSDEIQGHQRSDLCLTLLIGDSSKALVVEAIWNLPAGDLDVFKAELQQGKSLIEAAQSAGGQFAIVHRKIAEYTLKIEATLSESKATIDVSNVIDSPFEEAMVEMISNVKLSEMEGIEPSTVSARFRHKLNTDSTEKSRLSRRTALCGSLATAAAGE